MARILNFVVGIELILLTCFSLVSSSMLKKEDLPVPDDGGKLWVILAAGSNSWYNFRHQADVCHAYHIVHEHGIPDENIIVLMYDDIAFNEENPTPGVVINKPNGSNVYEGVPKDYTNEFASNETFIKILLGQDISYGSGKTLKSNEKDHVFVFFSDHGAPGIVAFEDNYLTAQTLNDAIVRMHNEKRFKKLVFYLEACESGSMFQDILPDNIDVYATTASNSSTSSYACYYDDERKTFLGDVYSVKWMEDSDRENILEETLDHQFDVVRYETNTSMVCRFGDMSVGKFKVADFLGKTTYLKSQSPSAKSDSFESSVTRTGDDPSLYSCGRDAVPSYEVPKVILERRIQGAKSEEERKQLKKKYSSLMKGRKFMEATTRKIVEMVAHNSTATGHVYSHTLELINYDCYYAALDSYHTNCFNVGCNDFALRQVHLLANMCQIGYKSQNIIKSIKKVCKHKLFCGIY